MQEMIILEVYLNKLFFSIDNCEWEQSKNWFSLEEDPIEKEKISNKMTFDETYDYLVKNSISNCSVDTSIFKKRKIIYVYDVSGSHKYKNFSTFQYKIIKEKYDHLDLSYILSHFPAKLTIKYLIDHGISLGGNK